MGMYDSVLFKCPTGCTDLLEVQSKAGSCVLREIDQAEVPIEIADDIWGDTVRCAECLKLWRVTTSAPSTMSMELRE